MTVLRLMHDVHDDPFSRVMHALRQRGPVHRAGAGFLACCPAHGDKHPSLSVRRGDDGRVLFNCQVGCSFKDIVGALGMEEREMFADDGEREVTETRPVRPPTLAELAAHKKLPVDFLAGLGWQDSARGVEMPYHRRDGSFFRSKIRVVLSGKNPYIAGPGQGMIAYEPDRGALAKQERYLVVVEGETDTATLLYAGFPVLGLPGANAIDKLEPHHIEGVERVFWVREPDRGGDQLAESLPRRLAELGFEGEVHELRMPDAAKDPSALWQRDQAAFPAKLCAALEAAQKRPSGPVEWRSTADIFQPLPPIPWRVRGLQLCPGRPAMLAGYGASAKTLSAQALALAVASGEPAWGFFETYEGQVRHLDYEQGWHATARRYQRLAHGHGISPRALGDRLKLAVFPKVYLDSENAYDAYAKMCEGVELVVLDALRGATPSQDENDSRIRACIDNLTRVSEATGCAFLLLHHAGKPKDGHADIRTILRGSSGIFDGCGAVYVLAQGKSKDDPRLVKQAKPPAEAEGAGVDDFTLQVLDVPMLGNPTAGVRVSYAPVKKPDEIAERTAAYHAKVGQVLEFVLRNPGLPRRDIAARMGMNKQACTDLLDALEDAGRVHSRLGSRGAALMYPGAGHGHNRPEEPDG